LALKWAISDKFKDYLYGPQLTILTDNNPATYVLTTAKPDVTGHRLPAALASFKFEIKYRSGRKNADADALDLSCLPTIDAVTVQAICHPSVPAYVEYLTLSPSIILDDVDPRGTSAGIIINCSRTQNLDSDIERMIDNL
jgi:hypothetical protein